jgi:hypothetical protein
MTRLTIGRAVCLSVLVGAALVGCSKEDRQEFVDDTVELAARNLAAQAGEEEFQNAGLDVEGTLNCTATSQGGADEVEIRCTGTSADGKQLLLEGTLLAQQGDVGDVARGEFVGTADGEEIFSESCVGEGC